MHRKLIRTISSNRGYTGIVPDIGSVSSCLAKHEAVCMRRSALLENEHELMLGAVKCAHAAIGLVP